MINRRTLLLGTAGLAAGGVLAGCSRSSADSLDVTLLEGAIPPEVLQKFRKQTPSPVNFQTRAQMSGIFQQLQRWQQSPENVSSWNRFLPWREADTAPAAHHLVSLGDYWLTSAIAQDLIEPLVLSAEQRAPLPVQWQQFVTRNPQGQIAPSDVLWAAPYKVQSLVIVYRQSGSSPSFETWDDLLMPSLKGMIALPDHPNLVIGLLQKMQTGSFNTSFDSSANSRVATPKLVSQLREQLATPFSTLNAQVRTYDSRTALKALVNEDLHAVVAWSGDVVTALQRYRSLRAVVPKEGSLLSADMWVRPKGAEMGESSQSWIDFCWESSAATQLSLTGSGISPIFLTDRFVGEASELPDSLAKSRLSPEVMQNSELLLPLPDAMQAAYLSLWQQLRTGAV